MKKETKLDVLWNYAGVSQPALGSLSKQGVELQMATNCLGPLLFTQCLLPCLKAAVKTLSLVLSMWSGHILNSQSLRPRKMESLCLSLILPQRSSQELQ
ncbi:short-chain dehydrogenase [Botrytis cinerea]